MRECWAGWRCAARIEAASPRGAQVQRPRGWAGLGHIGVHEAPVCPSVCPSLAAGAAVRPSKVPPSSLDVGPF